MISDLTILRYAEDGALQELARRGDLARKHDYAPEYLERIKFTMSKLEEIRKLMEENRIPTTNGGVNNG